MKNYTFFGICLFVAIFTSEFIFAKQGTNTNPQQGFTGTSQQVNPVPQQGFTGNPQQGFIIQQGFTGPGLVVTVSQVNMFANKSPVILNGNIVQAIGADKYIFRDTTGDITVKIKQKRWWGLSVSPSDKIEISGNLKRDKRNWQIIYVDAKYIKKI